MQTTLEERTHRGARAREVLENEEFQAAFAALEQGIIEQWKQSPAKSADDREKLYQLLNLLGQAKRALTTTMETGKLAQLEIQHKQTLMERARGMISRVA